MSTNLVVIDGTLGRDAELKTTTTGKQVANFSVAVDNGFGANKKEPFWFNIVAWNELAETASRLTKGSKLTIYGRLTSRSYEKDGQKKTVFEIVANAFDVRKADGASNSSRFEGNRQAQPAAAIADDDIPF